LSESGNNKHKPDYSSVRLASRLSHSAWKLTSSLLRPKRKLTAINAFFKLIRPGRVLMISSLTWVSASVAKVPFPEHWIITFGGMFLAMAGFSLDIYADRETDKKGSLPWPVNPISTDMMTAKAAQRLIVLFLVAGLSLCAVVHLLTLVPATILLITFWGLAAGVFDGPFGRAITLGLLQALYVLLAAAATGSISGLMIWVATVFFTAMVGARALGDIRDLPSDLQTDTRSLAKVFGIRVTSWILPIAITISLLISLRVYTLGAFDKDYLILTFLSFGPGIVMAWSFFFRPTPNYAFILQGFYWSVGILYMLALFIGSR
jgi:4-hydroxybenzoate polyprenyltransferase